jgi:hypothetical protein
MGEKGLDAIEKLPLDYYIPAPGSTHPGPAGKTAPDVQPGEAYPNGRPGHAITWDAEHGAWRPPGFNADPTDPERVFNQATGQNGVWDGDKHQWIDAATGQTLTYEQ